MQFSNSVPIYLQVMEDMKREMVTGGLPAGSRVESIRVLAARYGIKEGALIARLHRLRKKLAFFLEKEGISV